MGATELNLPSLNRRLDRLDRPDSVPTSLRDRCLLFGVTILSITDANRGYPQGSLWFICTGGLACLLTSNHFATLHVDRSQAVDATERKKERKGKLGHL